MTQTGAESAVQKLLLLPTISRERFQNASDKNQALSQVADSQNQLIDDLATSIPEIDDMMTKISNVDKEIANVELMLLKSNRALQEILTTGQKQSKDVLPGPLLSSVLLNVQQSLLKVASESAAKGHVSCNLLNIIDIEDQISKFIDGMIERNLYPETEEDFESRNDRTSLHNQKIVQFLQLIQAMQKQSAGDSQ